MCTSIVARSGPASATFNEFTSLFERQDAQLNATGVVGDNDTYGSEGVVSMLYDRYSLSAGMFHFETEGWRRNYDVSDDIYNLFGQAAITPELNAQVEFRHRTLDQGDLQFNFDPDFFSDNLRRDLDQNIARAGLRYSPTPRSDFLLSSIHNDRQEILKETIDDVFQGQRINFSGTASQESRYQLDGQYIYHQARFNVTTGLGFSDVDNDIDLYLSFDDSLVFEDSLDSKITNPHGYI